MPIFSKPSITVMLALIALATLSLTSGCSTTATSRVVAASIERQCYSAAELRVLSRERKLAALKNNETAGIKC